jgi:hypothetical protein
VETRGFDDLHAALFTESRTRGPSQQREVGIRLRSGRDDNSVMAQELSREILDPRHRIVIPTGAKRSGGTCAEFSRRLFKPSFGNRDLLN